MKWVFVKDRIVGEENAKIDIKERGFRFGDGIFETIRIENYIPYQLKLHLARLGRGVSILRIKTDFNLILENIPEIIRLNDLKSGFIRISVSRGIGSAGYMPDMGLISSGIEQDQNVKQGKHNNNQALITIESHKLYNIDRLPTKLAIAKYKKISKSVLPTDCKLMQGLNATLNLIAAKEAGYFSAISLTEDGYIADVISGNIFWVKNKILYTPELTVGILNGIIRQRIFSISPYQIIAGRFKLTDLSDADEIFITNVSWITLPIALVEGVSFRYKANKITDEFYQLIKEDIKLNC